MCKKHSIVFVLFSPKSLGITYLCIYIHKYICIWKPILLVCAVDTEVEVFFNNEGWRSFLSNMWVVFYYNLCYPLNGALEIISLSVFKSMKCMVIQTWISDGKLIAQFIQWLISWCYNWLSVNKCFSYWLNIW